MNNDHYIGTSCMLQNLVFIVQYPACKKLNDWYGEMPV